MKKETIAKKYPDEFRGMAVEQATGHIRQLGDGQVTTIESMVGSLMLNYGAGGPAMMEIPGKNISRWLWHIAYRELGDLMRGGAVDNLAPQQVDNDPFSRCAWTGRVFLDGFEDEWQKILPWAKEQGHKVDCTWSEIAANMVNVIDEAREIAGVERSKIIGLEERLIKK